MAFLFSFFLFLVLEILDVIDGYFEPCCAAKSYDSHMIKRTEQAETQSLFLTALCQHADSYKYGLPHQLIDVWEGLCDVLSLQYGLSKTFLDLM